MGAPKAGLINQGPKDLYSWKTKVPRFCDVRDVGSVKGLPSSKINFAVLKLP